jgi:dipeptidyl-peptidase-4
MSNPMEYFAESTEAYSPRNDFYPFNNSELRQHDSRVVDVVEDAWGIK